MSNSESVAQSETCVKELLSAVCCLSQPIMLGDARLANLMSEALLKEGIYVIGFSYPVVPVDSARIRVQMSSALSHENIDMALEAFRKVGQDLGVLKTPFGNDSSKIL